MFDGFNQKKNIFFSMISFITTFCQHDFLLIQDFIIHNNTTILMFYITVHNLTLKKKHGIYQYFLIP